jgi:dTDP-L-rhamnose 4-epimerase
MTRLLVTGGCGFIGRHVAQEFLAHGFEVRLYDSMIDQVHGSGSSTAPDGAELVRGDMRDTDRLRSALAGCSGVIHLAAEVGVGQSMYEIARYVGANDLGTAVLLDAVLERPVERIVVASSMSVYGEGYCATRDGRVLETVRRSPADLRAGRWDPCSDGGETLTAVPTDERKRPDLASIYALTKFAQERATMIFGEAYDTDSVALRLFNVFGPGQALSNPYTGVLANFAARLAKGAPPTIFEDGNQRRDFVHVEDVATAFRLAWETPEAAGQVFNIGSGHAYSIAEVARILAREMNLAELEPEILGRARAGDIRNCFADIGRARHLLGFAPARLLEDSLGPFVDWVKGETVEDRNAEMRHHLEARRLVS